MATENKYLFEEMPVKKAVLTLALPMVISQVITVIYNMADTFFIGQLGDPNQVAAATFAMPLFMLVNAIANLFGIGGASLVSRCLGAGNFKKAQNTTAFCVYTAGIVALVYGIIILFFKPVFLPLLGADEYTFGFSSSYLLFTLCIGAVPTVLSPVLSHLVRADGYSKQASLGLAGGGILNIILDPVFIWGFKLQITGAAIATLISNIASCLYFVAFIIKKRDKSCISFNPRKFRAGDKIASEVITVGLPSFVISMMASVSNMVLNRLIANCSNMAIAGMGIAKKINILAFAVAQGMTQGPLSLIAYNYSAKNRRRMNESIKTTFVFAVAFALAGVCFLFFGASKVCGAFINNAETVDFAKRFLKIICLACPSTTVSLITITVFQATGRKLQPLFISALRKGVLDIPFMFLFRKFYGVTGVAYATPVADYLAMFIALIIFIPFIKNLHKKTSGSN